MAKALRNKSENSTRVVEKMEMDDDDTVDDENANAVARELNFEMQLDAAAKNRLDFLMEKAELLAHFVNGSPAQQKKSKNRSNNPLRKTASTENEDGHEIHYKQKVDSIRFEHTPNYIKAVMRDYQIRGLNWLISLYENGINGILADEMGLGKTLQTISILGFIKYHKKIDGPFLVVCPKSTLENWMTELKRFCPTMIAHRLIGAKEGRAETMNEMLDYDSKWDVCVTTYEMVLAEKSGLSKFEWQYIAVDEAHRLKNENNRISKVLRQFHSTNRLLLTGTPLQNNLHELWALLNYLLPDVFASAADFDSWFDSDDCLRGNDNIVKRLHAILKPFMLRRIKAEVEKSLLPKIELKLFVGLTKLQRDTYIKVLRKEIYKLNAFGEESQKKLDVIVQELRKAANHPYLIDGVEPGPPYTTDEHIVSCCGKMMLLDKLLAKLKDQGSRVLIFSQFVMMLDILDDYLEWRGYKYQRIDGQTPYEDRASGINEFNAENSKLFAYLISTRAGGLGINLATADTVIIYDSDWNPQADLQAIDRAHRIGQKKQVRVFRLVTENTVDERIVQRADIKLRLDNIIIQQGRNVDKQVKDMTKGSKTDILHFGVDAIMASDESGINSIDIDAILKHGEKKTAEENEKLSKMGESQLRNMTLEEASSTSVYQFDGKDYREERRVRKNRQEGDFRDRKQVSYSPLPLPKAVKKDKIVFLHPHHFFPLELLAMNDQDRYLNLSVDSHIKEPLYKKGFLNWTVSEAKIFRDALVEYGRNDFNSILKVLPGKTLTEIVSYTDVFFERGPSETEAFRKTIIKIQAKEKKSSELKNLQRSLQWKLSQFRVPELELTFVARKQLSGKFTLDHDRFILCAIAKHGVHSPNVYERVKADISTHPRFRFDWFIRGRTINEIKEHASQLLSMISKEYTNEMDKENPASSSGTSPEFKHKRHSLFPPHSPLYALIHHGGFPTLHWNDSSMCVFSKTKIRRACYWIWFCIRIRQKNINNMVRVKYRYVVIKVIPQNDKAGGLTVSDGALYSSLMKSVSKYYGDFGVASIRSGLKCKYCNEQTRIAIVRVKHKIHRFVTSVLPIASVLGEHIVKYQTLYNGATIMQCNKFIVEYQKKFLDQKVGSIASANQRNNLVKNVMEISTVTR